MGKRPEPDAFGDMRSAIGQRDVFWVEVRLRIELPFGINSMASASVWAETGRHGKVRLMKGLGSITAPQQEALSMKFAHLLASVCDEAGII